MKKILLSVLTVFAFIIIIPSAVSALDISVGAATWYSWWDMSSNVENVKFEADPTLLYGPVFSVKCTDEINITGAFLYGVYDFKQIYDYAGYEDITKFDMTRMDGDFALNYRLMSYMKLFLGAKYTSYSFENNATSVDHSGIGTGAGVSFTLPVADSLYFIANVGGVYLWTTEETKESTGTTSEDCKDYGVNTTAQLAYYIEAASVTVSLGGRYQYLIADYAVDDSIKHNFWGATFSAIYSFSI